MMANQESVRREDDGNVKITVRDIYCDENSIRCDVPGCLEWHFPFKLAIPHVGCSP